MERMRDFLHNSSEETKVSRKIITELDLKPLNITSLANKIGHTTTLVRKCITTLLEHNIVVEVPLELDPKQARIGKTGRPSKVYATAALLRIIKNEALEDIQEDEVFTPIIPSAKEYTLGVYTGQLNEFFEALISNEALLKTLRMRLAGILAKILRSGLVYGDLTSTKVDLLDLSEYLGSLLAFIKEILGDSDIWEQKARFQDLSASNNFKLIAAIERYALVHDDYLDKLKLDSLLESIDFDATPVEPTLDPTQFIEKYQGN